MSLRVAGFVLAAVVLLAAGEPTAPVTLNDVAATIEGDNLIIGGVASFLGATFEVARDAEGDAVIAVAGSDLRSATIAQASTRRAPLDFTLTLDASPAGIMPGASWQWPLLSADGCPTLVAAVDGLSGELDFYVHHGYCDSFAPNTVEGELDGNRLTWHVAPADLRAPRGSTLEAVPSRPISAFGAGANFRSSIGTFAGWELDTMSMTGSHGIGGGIAVLVGGEVVRHGSYESGEPFRVGVPGAASATDVEVVAPFGPHEIRATVR